MQLGNRWMIAGFLSLMTLTLTAQNSTNSPYTRYGYGELANRSFGAGRAMGGTGIGLRSSRQINPMNPASYSSVDTLTFLFDVGATAQFSRYNDGVNAQHDINGNIDYIAMLFPVYERTAFSAGLMPYSHVGYNYGQLKTGGQEIYSEQFTGTGGLNLLYAGLSVEVWKKRLSVGANINYLFGSFEHSTSVTYSSALSNSVTYGQQYKFKNALYDFGLQYTHPLAKNKNLVAGLTFTPKNRMKRDTYESFLSTDVVTDTISGVVFDLPSNLGIGISYVQSDKIIIVADYQFQLWNKMVFNGKKDAFKNRSRVSVGAEYIPLIYTSGVPSTLFKRIRYRSGLSYSDSYIQINGKSYKEFGINAGLGFPISDAGSFVNATFEYVHIRPELKTMIKENYLRMTLSFTFNEIWFYKRKVH
jgi:hypothetical protein